MFERLLRIRLTEKDARRILFSIRSSGSTSTEDLSDATSILFEWENSAGVAQTPLSLSSTTPGADWATGQVVVDLGVNDVTANIGSLRFAITVVTVSQTRTVKTGVIEVSDRAGDTLTV